MKDLGCRGDTEEPHALSGVLRGGRSAVKNSSKDRDSVFREVMGTGCFKNSLWLKIVSCRMKRKLEGGQSQEAGDNRLLTRGQT